MDQYLEFISNHSMLVLALAVVTFLLIKEFAEAAFSQFKNLSPMNAVTKMNGDNVVIIDVREPHEFILGHIENAINTPLGKLKEQLKSLETHKNKDILVVCQSGTRSAQACKTLINAGFEKIFNLDGGMQAWEDNKFPIKVTSKNKASG
jgi:rhodanese-related sulfurtransferase